jgi:acetyl esterase
MRRLLFLMVPLLFAAQLSSASIRRDVEYGRAGDVPLLMDVSVPEGTGPFPAVIIVHGGGWIGGHREHSVRPLFEPLASAGFAWFSISYRLATNLLDFGVAVDDVQTAIDHVRRNAAEYRVDQNRIAVLGESAGGHLATLAVEKSPKSVAAVVALYPPSDLLDLARNTRSIPDSIREAVKATGMEGLIAAYLRQLSPIDQVNAHLPPFLLVHGTSDGIVPYAQSERMLKKLREAGVPAELISVAGGGHGLRGWETSTRLSGYRQKMIAWLQRIIGERRETVQQPTPITGWTP